MWTNDIRYLSGKSNTVADWLSRPPEVPLGAAYALPSADFELSALQEVALELINHKALAKAQLNCPDVISHRQGKAPRKVKMTDIEYSPGVTLYCDTSDGCKARPLVPKEFRDVVIRMFHQLAHAGQKETVKKVANRYYWPNMRSDVSDYVSKCQSCQAVKSLLKLLGH